MPDMKVSGPCNRAFLLGLVMALGISMAAWGQEQPPQPPGQVMDQIIARVNDDIITSNQYQQALSSLRGQIKHDCPACTQAQLESRYQAQSKNVLRDLIDQDLLVERAKDDGMNVDIQVVKQLDQMRQKYNLPSMQALQQAIESEGVNWSDFKDSIKRQLLTQQVIENEVGSTVQISHAEVQKYYDAHKQEFNRPESVVLREIFLSTKGMTPAQVEATRKKIENLRQRVLNGDDFGQLAKLYSQGTTAKQNGELGIFEKGQLAPAVEKDVFQLSDGQMTPVITMPNGLELLQVEKHYQAGIQPLDAVESEIENDIYLRKLGPALRTFEEKLRGESYIKIQPGYVDTAAVPETPIQEITPTIPGAKNGKSGD
jgi:peptidyl-prolyl cis-trans isomerase SurA